jgi:hypothetical protein
MFYRKLIPLAVTKTQENKESDVWGFARLQHENEDEAGPPVAVDCWLKSSHLCCHMAYRSFFLAELSFIKSLFF